MNTNYTLRQWHDALSNSENPDEFNGVSPGGAASILGVSRQTIYAMLARDDLDRLTLIDRAGKQIAVLITDASIIRYRLSQETRDPDFFAGAG
jgi:hypothetical protein